MPVQYNDRNLLFAVVALQNEFVTRDQLVELLNLWSLEKERSIGELMQQRQLISADDYQLIGRLIDKQMSRHQTAAASLSLNTATLDLADTRDELNDVELREVLDSLTQVPSKNGRSRESNFSREIAHDATLQSSAKQSIAEQSKPADRRFDIQPRYSILRSHAKGGLGEVFVARDHELGREVALKEIQLRMARDEGAKGRFELEACITGGLEHPGVVPVYGYGHYPDGRAYYAMRFIRGESLKDEISRFHRLPLDTAHASERRLAFRALLRRFVDCCNAIAYAHSRGVLHRDIKPANIMLGKFGETLVVDWGLAKTVGRDEPFQGGAESTLMPLSGSIGSATIDGSTLGTPAFMSPEQASGKIEELNSASDIFSLGSTFYNLLTGKLPFEGVSARDVINRVANNEFLPPVQVCPDLPKPLNSICLRAMEKLPADRYATALDLATDIEHYLGDEVVTAHLETRIEKTQRWLRRHRTLATAAAVLMTTIAIASAIGVLLVSVEKNRTVAALNLASAEKRAASAAWKQTRQVFSTVTDDLVGEMMARKETLTPGDSAFFANLLQQLEQVAQTSQGSLDQPDIQAEGLSRIANLQRRLERFDEAQISYRKAIDLWSKCTVRNMNDTAALQNLAAVTANLGLTFAAQGADQAALENFSNAAKTLQSILELDNQSVSVENSGEVDADAARTSAMIAPATNQSVRLELARLWENMANTRLRIDRAANVEPEFQQALRLLDEISKRDPTGNYRQDQARLLINYGDFIATRSDGTPQAIEFYQAAVADLESLKKGDDVSRTVQQDLALAHRSLGRLLTRQGKTTEALDSLRASIKGSTDLVRQYPGISVNLRELGRSQLTLAAVLGAINDPRTLAEFDAAVHANEELIRDQPDNLQYRRDLALALEARGRWHYLHDPQLARAGLQRALNVRRDLLESDNQNPIFERELIGAEINLANTEREAGEYEIALPLYQDLLAQLNARPPSTPDLRRAILLGLGDSLVHIGNYADALTQWKKLCEDPTDEEHDYFLLQQAICLARTGKQAEGIELALAVVGKNDVPPVLLYDAACCYAVSAEVAGEKSVAYNEYGQQAIQLLERAAKAGFFDEDGMKENAAVDADLNILRQRPDFKQLLDRIGIKPDSLSAQGQPTPR